MNYPSNALVRFGSEQTINNTTSWIGHKNNDPKDIIKGQTFVAAFEGDLEFIEVFSSIVTDPAGVAMTLYTYDRDGKKWGTVLGSASVNFTKSDAGKWVAFQLPGVHLNKGESYGFRLESHDSLIGIGEAAGSSGNPPYKEGQEWQFLADTNVADAFSYFSLTFKVALRA